MAGVKGLFPHGGVETLWVYHGMINEEITQQQSNEIVAQGGDIWATQPQDGIQMERERKCSVGQKRQIKSRAMLEPKQWVFMAGSPFVFSVSEKPLSFCFNTCISEQQEPLLPPHRDSIENKMRNDNR